MNLHLILKKLVIFLLVGAQLQKLQTIKITSADDFFKVGKFSDYNRTGNLNPLYHIFAIPVFNLSVFLDKINDLCFSSILSLGNYWSEIRFLDYPMLTEGAFLPHLVIYTLLCAITLYHLSLAMLSIV